MNFIWGGTLKILEAWNIQIFFFTEKALKICEKKFTKKFERAAPEEGFIVFWRFEEKDDLIS